jgi:hypothetical protein
VQRRQSLDDPLADEGLLVYAPLLEGAQYPFKFFNFVSQRAFVQQLVEVTETPSSILPLLCPY